MRINADEDRCKSEYGLLFACMLVLVCVCLFMLTAIFAVFFATEWSVNTDVTLYLLFALLIPVQNVSLIPP